MTFQDNYYTKRDDYLVDREQERNPKNIENPVQEIQYHSLWLDGPDSLGEADEEITGP